MADQQNYSNHARYFPLVHFVIMPLLALNFLSHLVRFIMDPSMTLGFWVLLSIVLMLMAFAARIQTLRAQDRVIRLEERLRYKEVLTPDLAAK
ncbi:MAG: DUF6526 family protein, partial [Pyrinomonadaceae bacterium]